MKIKKAAAAVAATAAMFSLGAVPLAWATSNIQVMGVQETLKDMNGPLIGYTVTGLMPSSDPVPYPVAGRLYEATVKADALVGTVIPVVPFFNARADSGANYRVLANVSTLSGAPIGQGGSTTGKIYFDVVGDVPNSVVFNNGSEDILGWIQTANPATPGGSPTGGGSSTGTNGGAPGGGGNAQVGPFGPGGNAGGNSSNGITGNDPGAGGGATGSGGSGAAGATGSGAAGGGAG